MKVSIVTICYNGVQYLEQTIHSVLQQTYPDIEYIIIDGGSTDGSIELIKKYQDKIYYWISEPDGGISDAFNKGIRVCTGEIIGLINCDDWFELDAVEKVVAAAKANSNAEVFYGNMQTWENGAKGMFTLPGDQIADLKYEMILNHPSCFAKKKAYDQQGLFLTDFRYAMDYELMLRFYLRGVQFKYIDDYLANMRNGGASDLHWLGAYKEIYRAHQLHLKSKFLPCLNFIFKSIRTALRIVLNKCGLHFIVVAFRCIQSRKKY